jgi:hypothetical protein
MKVFRASDSAGCYLCVFPDGIWEAWVWDGDDIPPHEYQQAGYRWRQITDGGLLQSSPAKGV